MLSFEENPKEKNGGSKVVVDNQVVGAISDIAKFLFAAGDTGVKLVNNVLSSVKVLSENVFWIYLGPLSQN